MKRLEKRLKKLRDELAETTWIPKYELGNMPMLLSEKCAFKTGFDAATKELMHVIEIQREGLNKIAITDSEAPFSYQLIAAKTMDKADAILNGEKHE